MLLIKEKIQTKTTAAFVSDTRTSNATVIHVLYWKAARLHPKPQKTRHAGSTSDNACLKTQ